MSSQLNPYLNFTNNTREAMEFYQSIFGGKLDLTTYKEGGVPSPSEGDKIMHASLETDEGYHIMAADLPDSMEFKPGSNVNMSISGDDEALLRGYFEKLSEGGTIMMKFEKAPWGDLFGSCTDKFGIHWMVDVLAQ